MAKKASIKKVTAQPYEGAKPVSQATKHNWLIYAPPGVGKTPFIGTSEKALILDADNGAASAAIHGSNAEFIPIEDFDEMTNVLEYFRHTKPSEIPYKWVWLDGITLYQQKGLEQIMEDLVAAKPHRDIDLPDRGEFRQNYERILRWVRHMSACPVNFGITAHVMFDFDQEKNVPLIAGSGKAGPMWSKVCGWMNAVGYLRIGENEKRGRHWVLHFDEYQNYYTKAWFSEALRTGPIREPTIPKIESLVARAAPTGRGTPTASKRSARAATHKKKATGRRSTR